MRKVFVRDMMSNSSMEASYNLRKDEVLKTIREVHSKIGTPMDIAEITFLTQMNVIMNMLWGSTVDIHKAHGVRSEFRVVTAKIIELLATPNVSDFFPVLARFDIQGVAREMERLRIWVDRILDSIIDARTKMSTVERAEAFKNKGKEDFLQLLLALKEQEDTGISITLEQIKALLIDIVVGGTDTSATMVEWAMAEIMHNPEVMKKVQEELSDVIGTNNIVEESHLPKLHYLDALIKETFRLHPALPLLVPKRPDRPCVVGGYTIPKNTRVFLNVWAMHRDPEIWDSPLEFKPERFLGEASKCDYNGNNFQYLPFGSGRRICAGLPLAEKMVMYVLASLLHSFNWRLPEGEELDLSETFGIVMKKKTPLVAIPTQRLSSLELYA
ncbi:flavonoid 3',5'-hydroxylase 1-like isoform X2 [Actinidia eriantha]|nr:flavonoid 3',5'-hydroxylase 1-like isoform X2 [Actinidia eriantha]